MILSAILFCTLSARCLACSTSTVGSTSPADLVLRGSLLEHNDVSAWWLLPLVARLLVGSVWREASGSEAVGD